MKGKELFTKDHAERLKECAGKPYCPSNGTEGTMFQDRFCCQCENDNWDEKTMSGGCDIIVLSMSFDVDDSDYPKEWVYDKDGQPICTAWKERS